MRPSLSTFRVILTVFLPFALGYFLSYLYRNVNAVITGQLAEATGLGPASLGVLTSAYFLTFASVQIPLGVLLDRYGPRRVESVMLVFAAVGAGIFALGDTLQTLTIGRALIGLGVSACLMAALKANVMWWPRERLPLVNGLFMAFGGAGAVAATQPVQILLGYTDWRGVFWLLAAITLAVAILILMVVPEQERRDGATATLRSQMQGVATIFRSPVFWRIAPASFILQGLYLAYVGLWTANWLREVTDMPEVEVPGAMMGIAIAQAVGFISMGALADRLARFGITPLMVASTTMVLQLVPATLLILEVGPAAAMWTAFVFISTGSVLTYAILSQSFDGALAGRVNTALNLLVFVAAFVLQSLVGTVIDLFVAAGLSVADGHKLAFAGIIAIEALALVWLLLPRRGSAVARRADAAR